MLPRLTPVVKNLIIINVAIFIMLFIMIRGNLSLYEYFPLYSPKDAMFQPFQLVTSMFTHFSPFHILFNMIGLYFFGPLIESRIGGQKTFIAYIAGGLFSSIVFLLFYTFVEMRAFALLGASGAVYTILTLCALYFTKTKVRLLFPPVTLTIGLMVALYIGYDLISFLGRSSSGVAHLAHLGGAAMGGILWFYWEKMGTGRRK